MADGFRELKAPPIVDFFWVLIRFMETYLLNDELSLRVPYYSKIEAFFPKLLYGERNWFCEVDFIIFYFVPLISLGVVGLL